MGYYNKIELEIIKKEKGARGVILLSLNFQFQIKEGKQIGENCANKTHTPPHFIVRRTAVAAEENPGGESISKKKGQRNEGKGGAKKALGINWVIKQQLPTLLN